jgi:hypothetical protein
MDEKKKIKEKGRRIRTARSNMKEARIISGIRKK